MEKNVRLSLLFDLYGGLLSDSQFEVMVDFLNNDLTISEVAENRGITRQAVKDMVSKVERKLENFEQKLHLMERIERLEREIRSLKKED